MTASADVAIGGHGHEFEVARLSLPALSWPLCAFLRLCRSERRAGSPRVVCSRCAAFLFLRPAPLRWGFWPRACSVRACVFARVDAPRACGSVRACACVRGGGRGAPAGPGDGAVGAGARALCATNDRATALGTLRTRRVSRLEASRKKHVGGGRIPLPGGDCR